jgi:hypothetical protein
MKLSSDIGYAFITNALRIKRAGVRIVHMKLTEKLHHTIKLDATRYAIIGIVNPIFSQTIYQAHHLIHD